MKKKLIGIFVIVYSVLDLIECYTLKKTVKSINKEEKNDLFSIHIINQPKNTYFIKI